MKNKNILIYVFLLSILSCSKTEAQSNYNFNDSNRWQNVIVSEYLENDSIQKRRKKRRFYSSCISFYNQFNDSLTIFVNGKAYARCFVTSKKPRNMYDTIFWFERKKFIKDTIHLLFNNKFKVPLRHLKSYEYLYIYHYYGNNQKNIILLYYSNEGRYYLWE
jgi:hypothetical protein